jgi:glycosyltransferase involved in cell wall biosynthesis
VIDWLGLVVLAGVVAVVGLAAWNLRLFRYAPAATATATLVSVLIPARDEAAGIETAVRAACAQRLVPVEVLVLDDGSSDETPAILRRLARELPNLQVRTGAPLPPGWTGKSWACWQLAVQYARGPWLCFMDADVTLADDAVARALGRARETGAHFVTAFPREVAGTAGEALLVPLIHLMLLSYLPLARLRRDPRPALSAGCGQFMLVPRGAYLAADGHRALRRSLHDGIRLARRLKARGHPIDVFDGSDLATCRMYTGFAEAWRGFGRNAYEALGSPVALVGMAVLNLGLFVGPFVGTAVGLFMGGPGAVGFTLAAALVVGLRLALARRFGHPRWIAIATPVAVIVLIALQVLSFWRHLTGRAVVWRARTYPGTVAD